MNRNRRRSWPNSLLSSPGSNDGGNLMIRKSQSSSSVLPQTAHGSLATDPSSTDPGETRSRIASLTSGSVVTSSHREEALKHTNLHIPHVLLEGNQPGSRKVNEATGTNDSDLEPESTLRFQSREKVLKYGVDSKLSSSGWDVYDKEEPLITKTKKYYKKRAPLVPRFDDSEESLLENEGKAKSDTVRVVPTFNRTFPASERRSRNTDWIIGAPSDDVATTDSFRFSDGGLGAEEGFRSHRSDGTVLGKGMGFIYMIIPPDGGFGWWIMVLSFFSQVIVDGIIFSIGILLPEISKEFGIPISEAVLVASVQIGSYFTFGAIASALINRFGFRPVAIFGVLASALTIMAASFVNSAILLVALYSAVGGCTLSMIWVSSQLIVGYYFERYRPIANGFSCSGAGAGIFIFAFLTNYLLPIIGWRNVLRMQVGFLLLILFMSIAYVEVPPTPVGVYNREVDESSSEEYYGNFYVQDFMRFSKESSYSKTRSLMSVYEPPKKRRCAKCCSCCRVKKKDSEPHSFEEKTLIIKPTPMQREDLFYTGPADYDEPHSKENVDGKDIYLIGNTRSTKQANYAIHHIQKSDDPGKKSAAASRHTLDYRHAPKKRSCMDNMFVKALFRLFDFHLLKQFEFRVLVASAFLFPMGMNIPFVYSKARVTISKEYAYFITPAIGLSNFAVRIMCGFIAYKKRELDTLVCGGGLAFGGLVVLGSAFYGTDLVWFQIFYGLCYGVAPAVYSTLRALIYVRYLGLSKLTNAFGITALAMGLGVFMGTTISGLMVSITKDYVVPFAFAGVCLIVSGSLKLLLPSLVKARKRKKGAK